MKGWKGVRNGEPRVSEDQEQPGQAEEGTEANHMGQGEHTFLQPSREMGGRARKLLGSAMAGKV